MKQTKESFCGLCVAVPLALSGAAGAAGLSMSANQYRFRKKVIVISLLMTALFFLYWYKDCDTCSL
jgi:hypothetical protein